MKPGPVSSYGRTKLVGEQNAEKAGKAKKETEGNRFSE